MQPKRLEIAAKCLQVENRCHGKSALSASLAKSQKRTAGKEQRRPRMSQMDTNKKEKNRCTHSIFIRVHLCHSWPSAFERSEWGHFLLRPQRSPGCTSDAPTPRDIFGSI
jgi:hypothetical protein